MPVDDSINNSGVSTSHSESSAGACNACGFEAAFVPEGMLTCQRCQAVQYCSVECLKWDWKSGGHDQVCVDIRPADVSESTETAVPDDTTLVSMEVNEVFGRKPDDSSLLGPPPAAAEEEDRPNSLGTFFRSEQPPAAEVEEVTETEDEGSIEFIVEEEITETDETPSEDLVVIEEEESNSEEPDMEGSWRVRERFQVSPKKPLQSDLEAVQELTEASQDEEEALPLESKKPSEALTNSGKSSLLAFRNLYDAGGTSSSGGETTENGQRRSLKSFRDAYTSSDEKDTKDSAEETTPDRELPVEFSTNVVTPPTDTTPKENDGGVMPRYMQYRSSLSKSASSTNNTPTPETSKQGYMDTAASFAAAVPVVVATAATDNPVEGETPMAPRYLSYRNSLSQTGTRTPTETPSSAPAEEISATIPPAEESAIPRYMRYRNSLSSSATKDGKKDDDGTSKSDATNTALAVGAVAGAGVAVGAAISASKAEASPNDGETGPRYMKYRNSLTASGGRVVISEASGQEQMQTPVEKAESNTTGTGQLGVAAGAGVGAAAAVAAAHSGTVDTDTPRYMRYRNSLAQSSSSKTQPEARAPEGNLYDADENETVDVLADTNDGRHSDKNENRNLGTAAKVGAAAVAIGAGTAGIVAATKKGSDDAVATGTPPTPGYLRYRNSLAQSTRASSLSRNPAAESRNSDDDNVIVENNNNGVAAAAADGGLVAANNLSENDIAGETASAPTYLRYRNSLARSAGKTTAETTTHLREENKDEGVNRSGLMTAAAVGVGVAATAGAVVASDNRQDNAVTAGTPSTPTYMRYRDSLASSTGSSVSRKEAAPDFSEQADVNGDEEKNFGAVGAATGVGVAATAGVGAMHAARSGAGQSSMGNDGAPHSVRFGENGGNEAISPAKRFEEKDVERPDPMRSGSAHTLDSLPYKRRRWLKYGFGLVALVAIPLGIGLGVTSRNNDKGAPLVFSTSLPSSTPLETDAPTSEPFIVTDPPVPSPGETSSPTSSSTDVPVVDPSTAAPTDSPLETSLSPTMGSTEAPTLSLRGELVELLSEASFDDGSSILAEGSPQNRAFEWLLGSASVVEMSDARRIQRYSLVTFFYSTEGEGWTNQNRWLSEDDECTWFSRSSRRPVCDASGAYQNLDLGFNEVSGTIPPELALLTRLTRIELSGGTQRRISGPLPAELGALTELESFDVFGNAMTGNIPTGVGNWTRVQDLNFGFNQFSGPLPDSLGNMVALTDLNCNLNFLTGQLPTAIGALINLRKLSLDDNNLTGELPEELGSLRLLRELSLDGNGFTSLPLGLGGLGSLESLKVNRNDMTGPLLTQIGELTSLRTLELTSNDFTGEIPTDIGFLEGLRSLNLAFNRLGGTLPTELGRLSFLRDLQLQSNELTGEIPTEFGLLTLVTTLRVDRNDLTGRVPAEVCDTFEQTFPKFYLDCGGSPPEVVCPPGACCTYCCDDVAACECVYSGTDFAFLC